MDNNTQQCLIIMGACASVIITIVLAITYYNVTITKAALENGYEQSSLVGSAGLGWVKKIQE